MQCLFLGDHLSSFHLPNKEVGALHCLVRPKKNSEGIHLEHQIWKPHRMLSSLCVFRAWIADRSELELLTFLSSFSAPTWANQEKSPHQRQPHSSWPQSTQAWQVAAVRWVIIFRWLPSTEREHRQSQQQRLRRPFPASSHPRLLQGPFWMSVFRSQALLSSTSLQRKEDESPGLREDFDVPFNGFCL